jgi:SH3 domain protein
MRRLPLLFLLALLTAHTAHALDYGSVANQSAVLYDAPSLKAKKLYVASRYLPLEQVVQLNDWVKVRDQSGSLAWIEKSALSKKRFVVVTAALASVRQTADTASPLVFQARKDVALEWQASTGTGWVKVRHPDGAAGYLSVAEVWGD